MPASRADVFRDQALVALKDKRVLTRFLSNVAAAMEGHGRLKVTTWWYALVLQRGRQLRRGAQWAAQS